MLHVSLSFQYFIISVRVILKLDIHFFLKNIYLAVLSLSCSPPDLC